MSKTIRKTAMVVNNKILHICTSLTPDGFIETMVFPGKGKTVNLAKSTPNYGKSFNKLMRRYNSETEAEKDHEKLICDLKEGTIKI